MERFRVIGSVDLFDGQQNLEEWLLMMDRASEFAGWTPDQVYKAALFRLRGEAGEYAEQLRNEGKIKTWEELKKALKERYNTAGKELWHHYLLNTATQGGSTVQEWAQTVRKLSLLALGSEGLEIKQEQAGNQMGGEIEGGQGGGEAVAGGANAMEAEVRKKLLGFMRKSNFVRGLRSSLRQAVWRSKSTTFDEAVQAAAEEEAVESSNREEEVLSCYKRDLPRLAQPGLVDQIVAALEVRDEMKRKGREAAKEDEGESTATSTRNITATTKGPGRRPIREAEELEEDNEDEEYMRARPRTVNQRYQQVTLDSNSHARSGGGRYEEQLPLPRNGFAGERRSMRQEWRRQDWNGARGENRGSGNVVECFNCGGRGHFRRECPSPLVHQPQGNGYRRLQ